MINLKYNRNVIAELTQRGYSSRQIAIVMGLKEGGVKHIQKSLNSVEPTLKFITTEQKQRLLVLDRLLRQKPLEQKWGSNDYYYITILKFLLIPQETIKQIYKHAPQQQVAMACKEKAPKLQSFNYKLLSVTSEEYELFVRSCYYIIGDPTKWK